MLPALVTPILPDGTVLSKEELDAYIGQTLDGAEDILEADSRGIVIGVDVDPDGAAAATLQRLQEAFYDLQQNAAGNQLADEQINRAMQAAAEKKKPNYPNSIPLKSRGSPATTTFSNSFSAIIPRWRSCRCGS